ncbi:MAG: SGNH/GDSL hydrolase family protein [Opitutaceae bacterium]|nr:SGNH/GDSL hydrolase family protein [Cytophagales bacterium]
MVSPHDPLIQYAGRIDFQHPSQVSFSHPGISIKLKFEGKICNILLENEKSSKMGNYYNIIVDGKKPFVISVEKETVYKLELAEGVHILEIFKRTENFVGTGIFKGIEIEKGRKLLPLEKPQRKIEFIGNSITCGYGNEGDSPACPFSPDTENNYLAYGSITARNLKAEFMTVAFSGIGVIRNYDKGKQTMPVIYDQIFPDKKFPIWDFKKWTPDAVVINLGTNDFAHSVPDSALFISTYVKFLKHIRKNYPKAHIFCIEGSMLRDGWPNGIASLTIVKRYVEKAVQTFKKENDSKIDTFYLSTAGENDLGCDYHPNVKMHQIMAAELTGFMKTKLGW